MAEEKKRGGRPVGKGRTYAGKETAAMASATKSGMAAAESAVSSGSGGNPVARPAVTPREQSDRDSYNKRYGVHSAALEGVRRAAASGKHGALEASKQVFWTTVRGGNSDVHEVAERENRDAAEGVRPGLTDILRRAGDAESRSMLHADLPTPCSTPGCADESSAGTTCSSCTSNGM